MLAEPRAPAIAVIAAIVHCAIQPAAAQSGNGIIVAPTVTDGSAWRGTFVLAQPTTNVRVRYSSAHCAAARQYARTILAITESGGKYNNVWMAVERSKGGPVEAASFTPPFDLPAGSYTISIEGKTDGGKPLNLAVCVGIGDACAAFERLAPPTCRPKCGPVEESMGSAYSGVVEKDVHATVIAVVPQEARL